MNAAKAKDKAKVPDGSLQRLIGEAKDKFENVDESFNVSWQTDNARLQKGKQIVWH